MAGLFRLGHIGEETAARACPPMNPFWTLILLHHWASGWYHKNTPSARIQQNMIFPQRSILEGMVFQPWSHQVFQPFSHSHPTLHTLLSALSTLALFSPIVLSPLFTLGCSLFTYSSLTLHSLFTLLCSALVPPKSRPHSTVTQPSYAIWSCLPPAAPTLLCPCLNACGGNCPPQRSATVRLEFSAAETRPCQAAITLALFSKDNRTT